MPVVCYSRTSDLFWNFQWGTGYDNEKLTCQESFLASFDRKETLLALFWCSLSNILNEIEMLTFYGRLVKMNKLSFPRVCNQNCLYWKLFCSFAFDGILFSHCFSTWNSIPPVMIHTYLSQDIIQTYLT
jgi:hypothetical protein